MKKVVLLITVFIMSVALVSCKGKEDEKEDALQNNAGSITFADVSPEELEEYADNEKYVFLFWVEESSGKSRKEIYDMLFKDKTKEEFYLATGIVIMNAKDLLNLAPVEGLNIELKEYRYEDYIITREYIEKCEADADKVKIFVSQELIKDEYRKKENSGEHITMVEIEKKYQEEIIEDYQLDVDYISRDDMYHDGYYIVAYVEKEIMLSLYEDERVQGMTKCIYVEDVMGSKEYRRPTVFNGWIEQIRINWPEK